MLTLFNVISEDGFIADKNGNEDFIPDEAWDVFLDMCKKYDTLIMGRKTYEAIQGYDKSLVEPFEALSVKKIVVSNDKDFHVKELYNVVDSPEDAYALDTNALVSSGPTLNKYMLDKNLVGSIILHQIPVRIGAGLKPFDDLDVKKINKDNIKTI